MDICKDSASDHKSQQIFKFLIKGKSITRATVTIHAEDVGIAWKRLHALFPGSDLSDTEVKHTDRP